MPTEHLVRFTPTTTVDLAEVATFEVTGPDTAEVAVEYREGVKLLITEIESAYKPHIARAHQLHKGLTTELKDRLLPATIALDALNRAIGGYEWRRTQAEEKARREAEAHALWEAEKNRALDAEAARAKGNEALATDIEAAPVEEFMGPVVVPTTAKTAGVAVTARWTFEVTDFDALVTFAAAQFRSGLQAMVLQPNEKGLQGLVDQLGEGFNVPGVRRVAAAPVVRSTRKR